MRIRLADRRLASGVLALYVLVVGLLLPLHAAGDAPTAAARGGAGLVVDASCDDRDCHDPDHHHGSRTHDPATCGSCVQAKVLAAPVQAGLAAAVVDVPRSETRHAVLAPTSVLLRAHPPARGPPTLS